MHYEFISCSPFGDPPGPEENETKHTWFPQELSGVSGETILCVPRKYQRFPQKLTGMPPENN